MKYDVVCAGELLIDLISERYTDTLGTDTTFRPYPGGSPANLATNLRHLGVRVGLVSSVGSDMFGDSLFEHVRQLGLDTRLITRVADTPTTLVAVTRSQQSPSFEVFRGADAQLSWDALESLIDTPPKIFHTTCFSLSCQPARSYLMRAADDLVKAGTRLSIDANYAYKVWPNRAQARGIVEAYISQGALVKMSNDDWQRLYEEELTVSNCLPKAERLRGAGAHWVCFTFGAEDAVLVTPEGHVRLSPKPVKVVDTTGAGDSFWSGVLTAFLEDCSPGQCLQTGLNVAAHKLGRVGSLQESFDWRASLAE